MIWDVRDLKAVWNKYVYMCMYPICMYVCMSEYAAIHLYIYIYIYVCMYIYIDVYAYAYADADAHVY